MKPTSRPIADESSPSAVCAPTNAAARNCARRSACPDSRVETIKKDANVSAVSIAAAMVNKLINRVNPSRVFIVDKAYTLSFADYFTIKETPFVLIV